MKQLLYAIGLITLMLPAAIFAADEAADAPLNRTELHNRSVNILIDASVSDIALLRANALEGLHPVPQRALPLTSRLIDDPNPGVRYAAVVTAGMLKFDSLVPMIRPLLKDDNTSVRAAAIYALNAIGESVDLTPLAGMLERRDPKLRSNVAQLLGMLDDPSAIPMLRRAATLPMPRASASDLAVVRIQVAEAMAKLGDDKALDALRAGAFSQFDEVRVLSVIAMGAVGDRRMEVALEKLASSPPVELQLAAAGSLARLGNTEYLDAVLTAADHENMIVRGQAAMTLSYFNDETSLKKLAGMLDDPQAVVRVSAAAAILKRTGK